MSAALHVSTGSPLNQLQHSSHASNASHGPVKSARADDAEASDATSTASEQHTSNTTQAAQSSQKPTAGKEKHGDTKDGKDDKNKNFTSLIHSMMQADKPSPGLLLAPTGDVVVAADKKTDAKPTEKTTDAKTALLKGMPGIAGLGGKGLPQLTWSGVVAVGDNKGASALAMKGSGDKVESSSPVADKDISGAILKAEEKLTGVQSKQAGSQILHANGFSAALTKQQLSSHLTHSLLAENASLTQNVAANAVSNGHSAAVNAANALAGANNLPGNAAHSQQINIPVQQSQWSQQLGDRVQWLISQDVHQAAIHLNPPELGALDVHIQMHGDQASVNFSSPHALVRHAVDAALPRLREMMQETGLTLGNVNVSGQMFAQQQSRDPQDSKPQRGHTDAIAAVDGVSAAVPTSTVHHLHANGMLDVYA